MKVILHKHVRKNLELALFAGTQDFNALTRNNDWIDESFAASVR